MKLCTDTVTVLNRRIDQNNGWKVYIPTIIRGVSWHSSVSSRVGDKELVAANQIVIRIPQDADFSGKEYVDKVDYDKADSPDGIFTFANGDIIVKACINGASYLPSELKEKFTNYCTILGVTDNRRAPNAPHWKLVGS